MLIAAALSLAQMPPSRASSISDGQRAAEAASRLRSPQFISQRNTYDDDYFAGYAAPFYRKIYSLFHHTTGVIVHFQDQYCLTLSAFQEAYLWQVDVTFSLCRVAHVISPSAAKSHY